MSHLVLSRRLDERIAIELEDGRVIWVQVLELNSYKARVGISAPSTIQIRREELYHRIKDQQIAADPAA